MAQFTLYKSTDASAPTLTGQAGSLITLLQAVLVNGYGSQSAAGWTQPYSPSSNVCMFTPGSGTGRILRVQDDASLTGGARDTIIRGCESATSLSSFSNAYPTAAQQTNGINWRKSNTADTTARAWWIYADSRTMYMIVQTGDTGATTQYPLYAFGDFYSYNPSDVYNSIIIGCIGTSASTESFSGGSSGVFWIGDYQNTGVGTTDDTAQVGHYVDRSSTGTGSSTQFSKKGGAHLSFTGGTTTLLVGGIIFPNPADGGLYIHPIWVMEPQSSTTDQIHGELRGLYHICHPAASFSDQDTFSGAGPYAGRSFIIYKSTPNAAMWCFETSNTVNSN